ncbi:AprI/Inh family metalloprotease inhibitor [Bosea sp. TWI1241]|uniref:AprI/Inh family metalloprotease inhibitor n=1 Tax=Bosea sp. TWI1241 TaxID=3148904 RepID=UPI00320A4098
MTENRIDLASIEKPTMIAKTRPLLTTRPLLRIVSLLPLLALGACAGSQRFGGGPGYGGQPVARAPIYNEPVQTAPPIQSAPVTAEPLPPPGGYPQGGYPPPQTAQPGGGLPPQSDPFFEPQPGAPAPGAAPGGQLANADPRPAPSTSGGRGGSVGSRDGVVGNWTAQEATGGSCRVQLSSSPALDLYRASANGCSNRDLQQVNAWDYRNGEVYLYQRGGSVVARLKVASGGAMNGAIAKSGAALSLNR